MPPRRLPRGAQTKPASENIFNQVVNLVGKFVAPTTAFSAVWYYFGWVRTNALYGYFGIDQSLLNFSATDYFLRSITSTFEPVRWLLLIGFVSVWANYWFQRKLQQVNTLARFHIAKTILIGSMLISVFLAYSPPLFYILRFDILPLVFPSAWLLGMMWFNYSFNLWLKLQNIYDRIKPNISTNSFSISPSSLTLSQAFLLGLVLFGVLWWVAVYADNVGKIEAQQIERNLSEKICVYVYSQSPLDINIDGINMTPMNNNDDTVYHYSYSGLRLLVRANGKFFLLPANWSEKNSRAIIIPDDEEIRVETSPGRFCSP